MKITTLPLTDIKEYAGNPRLISDDDIAATAASINSFGWQQTICVDEDYVILAGHTAYRAARLLGLSEAPCDVVTGLTAAQKRAYRIADNRAAEFNQWDWDKLGEEILQMDDPSALTPAFDADAIAALVAGDGDGVSDDTADEGKPAAAVDYQYTCPHCGFEF